ncbi:hypothetical protein [Drancourtella sp. An12]|nr:hypothetical protein [Drancourtella sp. An12]
MVAVKDITDEFPISAEKVADALRSAHFGKIEIDLITRCLQMNGIAE